MDLTDRSQYKALPKTARSLRPKGSLSWPYALVVSPDLTQSIHYISYKELKDNIDLAAAGLSKKLTNEPELLSSSLNTDANEEALTFLVPFKQWTNLKGDHMVAAVLSVEDGIAVFVMPNRSKVSYALEKLSPSARREILSAHEAEKQRRSPQ
ncbi:MAG: hypothetical protein P1U58_20880 [Verrucomicrobiales bacterium]|nr:hypothetical protein [Verrucomicrobiales bacterium]